MMFKKALLQKQKCFILRGILPVLMVNMLALSSPLSAREIEDQEIEQNIKHELLMDPFVESRKLTVTVKNGAATLTGTVESWTEYAAAAADAFQAGAEYVLNHLEVTGNSTSQDGKDKNLP